MGSMLGSLFCSVDAFRLKIKNHCGQSHSARDWCGQSVSLGPRLRRVSSATLILRGGPLLAQLTDEEVKAHGGSGPHRDGMVKPGQELGHAAPGHAETKFESIH